jgi:hypothetical protein
MKENIIIILGVYSAFMTLLAIFNWVMWNDCWKFIIGGC